MLFVVVQSHGGVALSQNYVMDVVGEEEWGSENYDLDGRILNDPMIPFPLKGFRVKVLPLVDTAFVERFGKQTQKIVDGVFKGAQERFLHESLRTKFELDVLPLHKVDYQSNYTNKGRGKAGR